MNLIDHFWPITSKRAIVTSADPGSPVDIMVIESSILQGFSEFLKLIDKKGKLYIQKKCSTSRLEGSRNAK